MTYADIVLKQADRGVKMSNDDATANEFENKYTGSFCSHRGCSGALVDTVIEFGQTLYDDDWTRAKIISNECDLMIVLGSSLVVDPARSLIDTQKK